MSTRNAPRGGPGTDTGCHREPRSLEAACPHSAGSGMEPGRGWVGRGRRRHGWGPAPVSEVEEDLKNQGVADVTSKVYRLRKATAPNGSLLPSGSLGASHWHRGKRLPLWATAGWLTGDRGSLERRVWRTRQAGQGPGTRHRAGSGLRHVSGAWRTPWFPARWFPAVFPLTRCVRVILLLREVIHSPVCSLQHFHT